MRLAVYFLAATCLVAAGVVPFYKKQTAGRPPVTIVTDAGWEVSSRPTYFGEYPLSAEQIASETSPLYGGTLRAVAAESNGRSQIVPGSVPIWRNRTADGEGEAYHFRKAVPLGADPIRRVTLQVNSDDVARVYINKRLVSVDKRDGKLKDGYDKWFLFRNVTGFMYNRIYTYDVTDYFFTNVTNTIFVEAVSLAFDGSHAYFSAKLEFEFAVPSPAVALPAVASAKAGTPPRSPTKADKPALAGPKADKPLFEAGNDPDIEKLHIGSILELGHVNFRANDYQLDTASYHTLKALASFMTRHPGLKIEVGGHTNLRPNDQFAAGLSANRAQTVMRFLTDNGVAADRLTYKGYGKSQPRIKAISKAADRANQRVEVKVLEK